MLTPNADPSTIEHGLSMPPHGPHTITTHFPGWETATRFRQQDPAIISRMKSLYPRFAPFGFSAQLCGSIAQKIPLPEGYGCAAFLSADALISNRDHAISAARNQHRLEASDFRYYVVEIHGVRFYVAAFPLAKSAGAIYQWQHGGLGFSTRLAEALLPHADSLVYMGEFPDAVGVPEPTYLPEGKSHVALRERIVSLMMRACASEHEKPVVPDDVYLYQSGMAAILRLQEAILSVRNGPVVAFGPVFHSTYHLMDETKGGLKHYGRADDASLDELEKYLEEGGECAYVLTEFPSNPILVSVDLTRLRRIADKHDVLLVVDDTCGSFANFDLLAAADVIITSLTKTFSGYADVLAGSAVLNPNSARAYSVLKPVLSSRFHNEFFEADAAKLLANNKDYLKRSAIHNHNADAIASYFYSCTEDPASPVARVWYPPYSPGSEHLKPFLRKPTPELPMPGYGCLLSVELKDVESAASFLDNLNLFQGPHLGAHLSLAAPFVFISYADQDPEVYGAYGLKDTQIRISAGLEDEGVLLRRCADAVAKASG